MRNPDKQAAKEAKIKADYAALMELKKYNRAYILEQVAEKHFLSVSTVESIVYGAYDARRKREAARTEQGADLL
jgi:hypothetical protein